MLLQQFPDLTWLKAKAEAPVLRKPGEPREFWPTVILNAQSQSEYRPDIRGTLSLFLNLSGETACKAGGNRARIDTQHYFLSNQHQYYTLEIDSKQAVETFNIHVGEELLEGYYESVVLPDDQLLNRVWEIPDSPVHFYNKLYRRDSRFDHLIHALKSGPITGLGLEENVIALLQYLLIQHRDVLKQVAQLPAAKASTRAELYLRLSRAVEYIHSCYDRPLDLSSLAAVACLSRHHFLRLFKQAFQQTPHQYLTRLRIEKACEALRQTQQPVYQVALDSGFENSSSFSRLFFRKMGCYPSQYRSLIS